MAQEASSAKHVFLVIGLNPAFQRIITLPSFQVGGVNRASSVTKDVGGKGQQVAKALHFYRMYYFNNFFTGPRRKLKLSLLFGILSFLQKVVSFRTRNDCKPASFLDRLHNSLRHFLHSVLQPHRPVLKSSNKCFRTKSSYAGTIFGRQHRQVDRG